MSYYQAKQLTEVSEKRCSHLLKIEIWRSNVTYSLRLFGYCVL